MKYAFGRSIKVKSCYDFFCLMGPVDYFHFYKMFM